MLDKSEVYKAIENLASIIRYTEISLIDTSKLKDNLTDMFTTISIKFATGGVNNHEQALVLYTQLMESLGYIEDNFKPLKEIDLVKERVTSHIAGITSHECLK